MNDASPTARAHADRSGSPLSQLLPHARPAYRIVMRRCPSVLLGLVCLSLALWGCHRGKQDPTKAENLEGTVTRYTSLQIEALRNEAKRLGTKRFKLKIDPTRCSVSPVAPNDVVKAFPNLSLKKEFALRAYYCTLGGDAASKVFAIQASAQVPEPPADTSSPYVVALPEGALENPMAAITGDDSPESYLQASLLSRELTAFGARWHPEAYGFAGTTVLGPPWSDKPPTEWAFLVFDEKKKPADFAPSVRMTKDTAIVVLYVSPFSGGILRHEDTYQRKDYVARTVIDTVAKSTQRPPMI